jgi:hypothetical protein
MFVVVNITVAAASHTLYWNLLLGHLVKLLVDGPNHPELIAFDQVRVLDLNAYDPTMAGTLATTKVVATQGSITNYDTVSKVGRG